MRSVGQLKHTHALQIFEYVTPEKFDHWGKMADEMGFLYSASGVYIGWFLNDESIVLDVDVGWCLIGCSRRSCLKQWQGGRRERRGDGRKVVGRELASSRSVYCYEQIRLRLQCTKRSFCLLQSTQARLSDRHTRPASISSRTLLSSARRSTPPHQHNLILPPFNVYEHANRRRRCLGCQAVLTIPVLLFISCSPGETGNAYIVETLSSSS